MDAMNKIPSISKLDIFWSERSFEYYFTLPSLTIIIYLLFYLVLLSIFSMNSLNRIIWLVAGFVLNSFVRTHRVNRFGQKIRSVGVLDSDDAQQLMRQVLTFGIEYEVSQQTVCLNYFKTHCLLD